MPQSLARKAEAWVAHTGFSMELRVARHFDEAGFSLVIQSPYFEDPYKPGTFREVDIIAEDYAHNLKKRVDISGSILIECKYESSEPWIVLTREWDAEEPLGVISHPASELGRRYLSASVEEGWAHNESLFSVPRFLGYNVIQPNDKWQSTTNTPYEAVQKVLTACELAVTPPSIRKRGRVSEVRLAFPAIVLNGPLLECHLGKGGRPVASPCRAARVLRNVVETRRTVIVDIVTEASVRSWARQSFQSVISILEHCSSYLDAA